MKIHQITAPRRSVMIQWEGYPLARANRFGDICCNIMGSTRPEAYSCLNFPSIKTTESNLYYQDWWHSQYLVTMTCGSIVKSNLNKMDAKFHLRNVFYTMFYLD